MKIDPLCNFLADCRVSIDKMQQIFGWVIKKPTIVLLEKIVITAEDVK